jgi:hypothetical protein
MTAFLTGGFIVSGGLPVSVAAPVSLPGVVLATALLVTLLVIAFLALPRRGGFRIMKGGRRHARRGSRPGRPMHRWLARAGRPAV